MELALFKYVFIGTISVVLFGLHKKFKEAEEDLIAQKLSFPEFTQLKEAMMAAAIMMFLASIVIVAA